MLSAELHLLLSSSHNCSMITNCTKMFVQQHCQVKRSLQEAAKKGDKDVCKILAKEVVGSKRAVQKLQLNKVQINSIMMQMDNQVSMMRVTKSLQKSTEVMKLMGRLTKVRHLLSTFQIIDFTMKPALQCTSAYL